MCALDRRHFLKLTGAGLTAGTVAGLSLYHFRARPSATEAPPLLPRDGVARLGSWEDLYRQRWTWDRIARGSHGWLNCRSACAWDLFIKNGVVIREEQTASYASSEPGVVPDFNPRGCQKGACYTEVMYGPGRLTVPLKRVGERGAGEWQRISWEQALTEIAEKMVVTAEESGTDAIVHDLGPHFDQGPTTAARTKFFTRIGGVLADDWGEIGDLNLGATLTFGFPHMGGTSDEWFLSDFLVVWMMNPSVTQTPDAHFLYEARYNGSTLTVIDPQYSATAVHADHWIPIEPGTDAALALHVARHIWEGGHADWDYVREQTDLPVLVRSDNGRFLRGSDLETGGRTNLLYFWDEHRQSAMPVPGCEGSDTRRLFLEDARPAVEGRFHVTLADGREQEVVTVGTLLRRQLDEYTLENTARITGLHTTQIEQFAERFARAERPMILSSWGSNRFFHSDLMNRAKILCLSLKGAIGKRGSGFSGTGWFGMEGFELAAEMERPGTWGMLNAIARQFGTAGLFHLGIDLVTRRKTMVEAMRDASHEASSNNLCTTNSASLNYNYQGIRDVLASEQDDGSYPRSLDEYVGEAQRKGWMPVYPRKVQPKVWVTGGNNVLRRTNMPQTMLSHMWPKLELIVDINPKLSFTGMHADYLLPAAGYYEKTGFKYPVAYVPYLHYCDAAVAPVGESKDEWEIYSLLAEKVSAIARERDTPVLEGCGKGPIDLKQVHEQFSSHGAHGPGDAEAVAQEILEFSSSTAGMSISELKNTGIAKYTATGPSMMQSQLYNTDWEGEGVLTPSTHQVADKWQWPTLTGRQQFYIDHQWFLDAGEALPVHRPPPDAGGDGAFRFISCHARWSIHSIWRDNETMLRLQRGEPCVYLNPADARRLSVGDGDWTLISNRHGEIRMRAKHSTMVRPGVAFYFHAWEPHQFPDHKSYKWITPGLMKPLHFAGGEGHLGWRFAMFEPGTQVQDTRVDIRATSSHPGD